MRVIIESAFEDMVLSISKIIRQDIAPHRYHDSASIPEANTLYYFTKSLEYQCARPIAYFEYSCDSGSIDAVVVSQSSLFLVEAKSTLQHKDYGQKIKSLDEQAIRLDIDRLNPKQEEGKEASLRDYLYERIITPFREEKWGRYDIHEIWGIILADTFHAKIKDQWLDLHNKEYRALNSYKCIDRKNPVYQLEDISWWHLLGYKKLV